MASLLDRLLGQNLTPSVLSEERIDSHRFVAGLAELKRGVAGVTLSAIADVWNMTPAQEAQLNEYWASMDTGGITRDKFCDVLYLGSHERIYPKSKVKEELGITTG